MANQQLIESQIGIALGMHRARSSQRAIAEQLDVTQSAVCQLLRKVKISTFKPMGGSIGLVLEACGLGSRRRQEIDFWIYLSLGGSSNLLAIKEAVNCRIIINRSGIYCSSASSEGTPLDTATIGRSRNHGRHQSEYNLRRQSRRNCTREESGISCKDKAHRYSISFYSRTRRKWYNQLEVLRNSKDACGRAHQAPLEAKASGIGRKNGITSVHRNTTPLPT